MNIVTRRGMCALLVLPMVLAGSLVSISRAADAAGPAKAFFAGGCVGGMEEVFEKVPGVTSVTSGYMGGRVEHPSYEQVSAGGTGHAESVEVVYDPAKVSYTALLDAFWHNVDPVTPNAQFCDHGSQYRAVIFFQGEEQKRLAEESKRAIEQSGRLPGSIVTELTMVSPFYPAEDYHQDFYKKNPVRYKFYKYNCGRAQRLEELWGARDR